MVHFNSIDNCFTDVDRIRFTYALLWRLENFVAIVRWTICSNILYMCAGPADIQLLLWHMVLHAPREPGSNTEGCTLYQYELKLLGPGQVLFHERMYRWFLNSFLVLRDHVLRLYEIKASQRN